MTVARRGLPTDALGAPRIDRRPPAAGAPDLDDLVRGIVQCWLEVEARRRPLTQLAPLMSPILRTTVARRLAAGRRSGRPGSAGRIRSTIVQHRGVDHVEAAVTIERDGRVTAVAVTLGRYRGQWRLVELAAPESVDDRPRADGPPDVRRRGTS